MDVDIDGVVREVMAEMLERGVNGRKSDEQCGFRDGRECVNQIFC